MQWLLVHNIVSIIIFLICLGPWMTAETTGTSAYNYFKNPSFEEVLQGEHWQCHIRTSLWDYKPSSENEIRVSTQISRSGSKSLEFRPFSDNTQRYRAFVCSQYVNFQQQHLQVPLQLSFWIWSQYPTRLTVLLDIAFSDTRYLYVNASSKINSQKSESTFEKVCVFIPNYGRIRSVMLHIIADKHGAQDDPVFVDDVTLTSATSPDDECEVYTSSIPQDRHILWNFVSPRDKTSNQTITLCTQLTLDRLGSLETLAKNWQGPISATVLLFQNLQDEKETLTFAEGIKTLITFYYKSEYLSKYGSIHVVYEDLLGASDSTMYPVNFLRNIALSKVTTPNVFYIDVDLEVTFTESEATGWIGQQRPMPDNDNAKINDKSVFCVPLFQVKKQNVPFPKSKEDLIEKLNSSPEIYMVFDGVSHSTVNYALWLKSDQPYRVKYKPYTEPYFIVSAQAPVMNAMFAGYGRDKCAYSRDLHAAGYDFWVLPKAFLLSTPGDVGLVSMWQRSHGVALRVFLNSDFHSMDLKHSFLRYGEDYSPNDKIQSKGLDNQTSSSNDRLQNAKVKQSNKDFSKTKEDL